MKSIRLQAAVVLLTLASGSVWAQQYPSQQYPSRDDKPADKAPQVSDGERQAALKIQSATDPPAKLQAAEEFIKKHPKSKLRPQVATHIAAEVSRAQDVNQKISLGESFLTVFNEPTELDLINPLLTDAYFKAGRFDDALRTASTWVEKNPDDLSAITMMALIGTEQVKRNKREHIERARQYGNKAIEIIEANQRGKLDEVQWNEYKTKWLPYLYQSMGIVSLVSNNGADAQVKLEKAAQLNSSDPFTFYLLGQVLNESYQRMAQNYKSMPEGPGREQVLKDAQAQMDKIIVLYAKTVALAEGNTQYKQLHDQTLLDLQTYYKYRHKDSTDGLRELIDKHKKSTTP